MNKTVSINIGGFIFHIEEEAYAKLGKYLDTIRSYFTDGEGRDEIMGDIESRIAEMFSARVGNHKQVVTIKDVDEVIAVMGQPEAFIDGDEEEAAQKQYYRRTHTKSKRIFRDPDNQVAAGVCGGLGAYFNIDPIWFRIAFLMAVIFAGTGVLLYIILWLVIPEAKTTAEKLEMRGENVTVENIERTIKEEMDTLKQKFNDLSDGAKTWGESGQAQHAKGFIRKFLDLIIQLIRGGLKVFARVIGAVLVFIGIFFLAIFIGSLFGLPTAFTVHNGDVSTMMSTLSGGFLEFFGTPMQVSWGLIGILLMFCVPLIAIIYGGVKLLFNIHYKNRLIAPVLGSLWTAGIVIFIVVAIQIGRDFAMTSTIKEKHTLSNVSTDKVLYLALEENHGRYSDLEEDGYRNFDMLLNEDGTLFYDSPEFDIVRSETDSFELEIVKKANGSSKKQAYKRAENTTYSYSQNDTVVRFPLYFQVFKEDKWRDQTVKIHLKMPIGSTVYLSNDMKHIIYDIDNVTNTWDGDMINRRWKMTHRGLECVDCDNLNNLKRYNRPSRPEPPVAPAPPVEPEVSLKSDDIELKKWIEMPEKDLSNIHKYNKSREQFDYEMKKKLNEIFFEMRNNPKEACS